MSRRHTRILSTLLAGAAWWRSPAHAIAASAKLAQGDDPYFKQAQAPMQRILTQQRNTNRAKNVILIVGDGMGFSTVTATRIFEGQQRGVDGEFERAGLGGLPASRRLEDLFLRCADHRLRAERGGDDRPG